jgi:lysyl-tRNA synthetase class 2
VNGCALVGGDPIGAVEELPELLGSFRGFAHGHGWRVAVLGASERLLPVYRSCGLRAIYLGDEAVVRPDQFSLEGRAIRKVRQSAHRLRKAGYRVRVLGPDEADAALRAELREVSHDWRGRWPERGFVMTMDALWAYPEALLAVALDADGRVGGFLQLVPAPASDGWSLATMRRRRGTPNGLMEYLIVETVDWARRQHVAELSLNFAVFAEMLRADATSAAWRRGLRFCLCRLDRFFQLERLFRFNRKFHPDWRPRYMCLEHVLDLPIVGLAYLHAESLLTPPGPWARTHDLTTA